MKTTLYTRTARPYPESTIEQERVCREYASKHALLATAATWVRFKAGALNHTHGRATTARCAGTLSFVRVAGYRSLRAVRPLQPPRPGP